MSKGANESDTSTACITVVEKDTIMWPVISIRSLSDEVWTLLPGPAGVCGEAGVGGAGLAEALAAVDKQ